MSLSPYSNAAWIASDGVPTLAPNATIEVRKESDGELAQIYSEIEGENLITNPSAFADASGRFIFYADPGDYQVKITSGGNEYTLRHQALVPQNIPGTFTPTVTFTTPGDLSVSYTNQIGHYRQAGGWVDFYIRLSFTPTYTTASSSFRVLGIFPELFTAAEPQANTQLVNGTVTLGSSVSYPSGRTWLSMRIQNGSIGVVACGDGASDAFLETPHVPSGVAQNWHLSGRVLLDTA